MEKIGPNVMAEVKDQKLTIEINLAERLGPSKSGKTIRIASTEGNLKVPDGEGAVIGLNVYIPKG